jgi:hypothetical protein
LPSLAAILSRHALAKIDVECTPRNNISPMMSVVILIPSTFKTRIKHLNNWITNCVVQFARRGIDQESMLASASCLRDPAFAGMTLGYYKWHQ